MQSSLPLGLASLSAALKKDGIDVKIFDTAFYRKGDEIDENIERADVHHSVKRVDYKAVEAYVNESDPFEDFKSLLFDYKPNIVGISAVESSFENSINYTRLAKMLLNVKTIAGGVFPTLSPEIAIKEDSIDIVCVGEGESALLELCNCLSCGADYSRIKSLWVKIEGKVIKNEMMPLEHLDSFPNPDFSCFSKGMFYKPMQGKLFKTVPIEHTRGCPYNCTFCSEPMLNTIHKNEGKMYYRRKSASKVVEEMENNIKMYSPELFYFTSETFLAMSEEVFNEFIENYKKVSIPFWIQTRIETVTLDKLRKLQEVGLYWMTIGIEHGNEEFRRKILKRHTTNKQIIEVMNILAECEQGVSINNIIGLPFETKELIYDTIMLNRELFKTNNRIRCNISTFTPFRGSELYDLCVSNDLFDPLPYISNTNISNSLLINDSFTKEQFEGLYRTFPLYVYLPDEYLDRIRMAEKLTPEGNCEYEALNEKVKDYIE